VGLNKNADHQWRRCLFPIASGKEREDARRAEKPIVGHEAHGSPSVLRIAFISATFRIIFTRYSVFRALQEWHPSLRRFLCGGKTPDFTSWHMSN